MVSPDELEVARPQAERILERSQHPDRRLLTPVAFIGWPASAKRDFLVTSRTQHPLDCRTPSILHTHDKLGMDRLALPAQRIEPASVVRRPLNCRRGP